MSGVAVVRYLLANNAPMIAVVPAARIKAGILPVDTVLPAISVTIVSAVRRNTVAMTEAKALVTERVQVTLHVKQSDRGGADYGGLVTAMRLIRQACPNQRGTINGVEVVGVLPDIEGPDLEAIDEGILARSQDFMIRWQEAR